MTRPYANLRGQRFGRLTVIEVAGSDNGIKWRCRCSCGKETTPRASQLLRGQTRSCGCLRDELSATALARYRANRSLKARPTRPLAERIAEQAAELMRWGVPEEAARVRAEQMCAPLHRRRGDTLAQIREVPRETRRALIDEFAVSRPGA